MAEKPPRCSSRKANLEGVSRTLVLLTSTLLGTASLAAPQAHPDPARVSRAIDGGVQFLFSVAREDGGRRLDSKNERPGLRALVLYTLLKGGASATDPALLTLLSGLTENVIDQTYDAACLILALEAHDAVAHRAWIEALAHLLVDTQEPSGAWSYPGLVIDLSNTQYAALGLWAAAKAGVDVAPDVWRSLARGTLGYQSPDGGFSYTAPPGGSTGSMTAAGIGVLAICEQELALGGALDDSLARELAERRARATRWLADRFAVDTNPGMGAHHYYYLYGLERLAALTGLTRIGAHDWYGSGASYLLAHQGADGAWQHGSDLADQCFAVLFLERATGRAKQRLPLTGPRREPATTGAEEADVRVVCKVERGVALAHVAALAPSKAFRYLWPGEEDRGPRVARVEYLVGGFPAGVALGAPERPADDDAWPAFVRPRQGGTLVARVHLVLPPNAPAGLAPFLESPPLEVQWPSIVSTTSLVRGEGGLVPRARTKASSELKRSKEHPEREFGPDRLVDGNPATPWLSKVGDTAPEVEVKPRSAVRAKGVLLALPTLPGHPSAPLARPTRVEIVVNGRAKEALAVELASTGRTFVPFAEVITVKSIEVRIVATDVPLQRTKEAPAPPPTGLGEVGIVAAPER